TNAQQTPHVPSVQQDGPLQYQPTTRTVERRATIEQNLGDHAIVDTSGSDEWFIEIGAGVDQNSRHLHIVGLVLAIPLLLKDHALEQSGMACRRSRSR